MSDANSLPTGGPSESGLGGGRLAVPDTLNGQLLLLAYDRRRNRVDGVHGVMSANADGSYST
jgi:hypothetical protein